MKAEGLDVVGFGAGEPDFPTPEAIVEAAIEACRDPRNHRYTPTAGLPELRQAIAEGYRRNQAPVFFNGDRDVPAIVTSTHRGVLIEALKLAEAIAEMSPVAVALAKRSVNRAYETTLAEGVGYERASFLSLFGTPHQREGMTAFIEKRKADFD